MLWSKGCTLRIRREQGRIELIRFTTFVINRRWIDHRHATRTWNEYRVRSHDQHSDSVAYSRRLREHGFAFHVSPDFVNVPLLIREQLVRLQTLPNLRANFPAIAAHDLLVDGQHAPIVPGSAHNLSGYFSGLCAFVEQIARIIALLWEQRQWVAAEGTVVAADSLSLAEVLVSPRQSVAVVNASRPSAVLIAAFVGALISAVPRHMRALLSAVAIPNGTVADEIREGHRDEQRGAECVHRRIGVES